MEDQEIKTDEVVTEVPKTEEVQETEREKNLKAENTRKALEIQRLREELETKARPSQNESTAPTGGVDLTQYRDIELKAELKNPATIHLHDAIEEELQSRRFRRFQAAEAEKNLRLSSESERTQFYPETLDPTHPMSIKMSELMQAYHLSHNPAGRLLAARLASSELEKQKALAAGRKLELDRQADVNANFNGGARPAPKVRDTAKLEDLKKRAMSGDKTAQAEWFKTRGLI